MKIEVSQEFLEKIIDLYKIMSIDKISREVGISRHSINRILKDSGVVLRKNTEKNATTFKKKS